jgi:hypothetical protein
VVANPVVHSVVDEHAIRVQQKGHDILNNNKQINDQQQTPKRQKHLFLFEPVGRRNVCTSKVRPNKKQRTLRSSFVPSLILFVISHPDTRGRHSWTSLTRVCEITSVHNATQTKTKKKNTTKKQKKDESKPSNKVRRKVSTVC